MPKPSIFQVIRPVIILIALALEATFLNEIILENTKNNLETTIAYTIIFVLTFFSLSTITVLLTKGK